MRSWPVLCLFGALLAPASAQTTFFVGPGSIPEIRDALQIANPGDLIIVQGGTYAHFTATIGVTIRALTPGTVSVTWQPQFVAPACLTNPQCLATEGATVLAPAPGQSLHVIGIDFLPNVWVGPAVVRHCVAASGRVTLDQCSMQATGATALWALGGTLHLQDCAVAALGTAATGHGLVAINSYVTAINSAIGGNGAATPGDGAWLIGSTLQGSMLQCLGGASPQGSGAPALRADANSRIWISDSFLIATNQCPVVAPLATGNITRTTQSPGSAGCTTLPPGPLLGVDRPAPPQGGSPFMLRFRGDPQNLVVILVDPDLGTFPAPGIVDQPLSLGLVNSFIAGAWLTDSNGALSVSWTMPNGAPFVGRPLWFQAAGGVAFPFQVTPLAGGVLR